VKGTHQASLLGKRLAFDRVRFDHVYTSTAVRAITTAEIALRTAGPAVASSTVQVEHDEALLEQNQGDWEGKERKDVYTPQVYKEMHEQVTHTDTRVTQLITRDMRAALPRTR